MKIGLIDVDSYNYPNLPLMKLSAWHKRLGDNVSWYSNVAGIYDIVYMSKVFSFTDDYKYPIHANKVVRGGSGYCIELVNGKEVYHKEKETNLPYEIEHIYPDYSLYPEKTKDTAYGFLTRGCPRGCSFCHVESKEGRKSIKVADLSEFWHGQKNIVLCDPNILACKDWKELLQQLIDSRAYVDINQGTDIRIMTEEKATMLRQLKIKSLHFAWDRYEDKDKIVPKFKMFKDVTGIPRQQLTVFCLTGFDTTFEQDIERVQTLRELGYTPYVMVYNKYSLPKSSNLIQLQRWVNSPVVFQTCKTFEEYLSTDWKQKRINAKKLF